MYTVNCGSPSGNRCCYPKAGEADCDISACPNYCFGGTSCDPKED